MLGFVLGILPGRGAVIFSFVSSALEKRLSRTGAIRQGGDRRRGGAGAANNAAVGSGFIPRPACAERTDLVLLLRNYADWHPPVRCSAQWEEGMQRPLSSPSIGFLLIVASLLLATTPASAQGTPVGSDVLRDLAPSGKLRAAINFGNQVLAQRGVGGEPQGVSADLSRELARRLGVPLEFVTFEAAGKVFQAAKTGTWDIAFVAIEPVRAAEIEFTAPYVLIEGAYMVSQDSPLKEVADVDKAGVRIAVGLNSAYDLYLTRSLKNATIVRAKTGGGRAMIELFLKDKLDAAAGVRQQLESYAKTDPKMRVMEGRFMEIEQAMGTPKGRTAGVGYLRTFVEDVKASGFVADALKRSKQSAVVPPARAQ
jgi:polar amino acid transport system substrate-binding protein